MKEENRTLERWKTPQKARAQSVFDPLGRKSAGIETQSDCAQEKRWTLESALDSLEKKKNLLERLLENAQQVSKLEPSQIPQRKNTVTQRKR